MAILSIAQCILTQHANLNHAPRNISSFTTGIVDAMKPMQLSPSVCWQTDASFTEHFLSSSKRLLDGVKAKRATLFNAFYYWDGGIPVSDPIACYDYEQCTTTVTWDGKVWTWKTSKAWVTATSFQTSSRATDSYVRTTSGIRYTHTFNGPKIHTIYFNRLTLMLRIQQINHMSILRTPMYFWLNCSHLFPPDGVFGVRSDYF